MLDVADVPDALLEALHFAKEIDQSSADLTIKELARKIIVRLDPSITAMSAAVDRLLATAPVEDLDQAGGDGSGGVRSSF